MYRKFDISHCTQKEINLLNEFKKKHPDKVSPTVYYTTNDSLGMGYKLIATFDKPKRISMYGKIDFGDCIDITDYDFRLDTF